MKKVMVVILILLPILFYFSIFFFKIDKNQNIIQSSLKKDINKTEDLYNLKIAENVKKINNNLNNSVLKKLMKTEFTNDIKSDHYKNKVLVLIYHHIIEKGKGPETISKEQFKQDLLTLKINNYNIIKMDDFIKFITKGTSIPINAVLITFDDGYESFYKYAYPELLRNNVTATNFIIVKSSDESSFSQKIPHLSWNEMREMKKNGMSFYNHTYNLHYFEKVNKDGSKLPALISPIYLEKIKRIETQQEYINRIKNDFNLAEKRLHEELGAQPELFTFPYGSYNKDVIDIGKEIGNKLFFTTREGINITGNNIIYRINAGSSNIEPNDLINKMEYYD